MRRGYGAMPSPADSRADACKRGISPLRLRPDHRHQRRDLSRLVSKLMLEVNDPANCAKMADRLPGRHQALDNYGYSSHYCTPDTPTDAKILACGYWGAGLRVFDIRDPYKPREIAYYKPPAQRMKVLPGSSMWNDARGGGPHDGPVSAHVRFRTVGNGDFSSGSLARTTASWSSVSRSRSRSCCPDPARVAHRVSLSSRKASSRSGNGRPDPSAASSSRRESSFLLSRAYTDAR